MAKDEPQRHYRFVREAVGFKACMIRLPVYIEKLFFSAMAWLQETLGEWLEHHAALVTSLVAFIVLVIDYISGQHIAFPILFALPVGIAAWKHNKFTAYCMAILLPLVRVGFFFLWEGVDRFSDVLINAAIQIIALSFYGFLIHRVALQKIALMQKVNVLEGFLPICAQCKKIRNENGEYEAIEKYVSEHSAASFSHGLCSDCAEKLYPDLLK